MASRPLRKGRGGGARISARLSEKLAQRYGQGGCKPIQHVYGRVLLPPLKSADVRAIYASVVCQPLLRQPPRL